MDKFTSNSVKYFNKNMKISKNNLYYASRYKKNILAYEASIWLAAG